MSDLLTLNNGWLISKDIDGNPILHITPIPNTIYRRKQDVKITHDIYEDIASGETDLKLLFKKHNLHLIIMEQGSRKVTLTPKPKINTETKYQGTDFFVTIEYDKYYLEYRLARQGDGSRKFEISKEIYEEARTGKHSTSDLFKKFNLYHLDVSENDVK